MPAVTPPQRATAKHAAELPRRAARQASASPQRGARRFDSLAQEAFLNLWRTYDRLQAIEEQLFSSYALTAQQYNVLRLLAAAAPQKIPTLQVAARLISRAPDITRMLDRLEQQGWIERQRTTADRRTVLVGLTPGGKQLLERLRRDVSRCHARQLGHLARDELQRLIALLRVARAPHEPPESVWS